MPATKNITTLLPKQPSRNINSFLQEPNISAVSPQERIKVQEKANLFFNYEKNSFMRLTILIVAISSMFIIGSIIWIALNAVNKYEWYGYVGPIILFIYFSYIALSTFQSYRIISLESKRQSGFKIEENDSIVLSGLVPPPLYRLYKNINIKIVNLNWLAFSTYFYGSLIIIFLHIFGVFTKSDGSSWYQFIAKDADMKKIALEVYIVTISILVFTFMSHIFLTIWRTKKLKEIDDFYGYQILNEQDLLAIKRAKHRRNRWMFLVSLIVVFLPMYLIYRSGKKIMVKK